MKRIYPKDVTSGDIIAIYHNSGSTYKSFRVSTVSRVLDKSDFRELSDYGGVVLDISNLLYTSTLLYDSDVAICDLNDEVGSDNTEVMFFQDDGLIFILDEEEIERVVCRLI